MISKNAPGFISLSSRLSALRPGESFTFTNLDVSRAVGRDLTADEAKSALTEIVEAIHGRGCYAIRPTINGDGWVITRAN